MKIVRMKSTFFFVCCLSLSTAALAQHTASSSAPATAKTAHAAAWESIKEVNIERKRRVSGDIDIKAPENALFNPMDRSKPWNTVLINILINGAMTEQFKAYDGKDDHFITELSKEAFSMLISPSFDPSRITGFRIKEDSLLLRDKRSFVRIIGLAPLTPTKDAATGVVSDQPMFWVFYPDAIKYLTQFNVSTTSDETWYDAFESGHFKANFFKLGEPHEWKVITPEQKKILKARGVDTTGLK